MFKGLKSKLEDEAKKLQATVQSTVAQYGESISHQVGQIRSAAASDAGSESSANVSKRFFGFGQHNENDSSGPSHSVGGALMEEVTEGDLLGLDLPQRERTYSGGSNHSNESSFSTLFSSVPGMPVSTLDTIDSDVESTMDEHGSAVVNSASKEQISSVLRKLQGRAANYKDKYRDLVKQYNEVVTENNKCRAVLAQTQDKALTRIEKLRNEKKVFLEQDQETQKRLTKYEEMLKKCTEEIRRNRVKISELSEENSKLTGPARSENGDESDRISSEWKTRIERLEEEWTERLNKAEADAAITLAQSKADMHAALETKDREVEMLRQKCRTLEIQDGQANERWQKKVDELKGIISSLETEKSEQIEKLSEAKIQGVKAVRDEEEARRRDLETTISQLKENHIQEVSQLKDTLEKLQTSNVESSAHDSIAHEKINNLESSLERTMEENRRRIEEIEENHKMILEEQRNEHEMKVAELILNLEQTRKEIESLNEDQEKLKLQNINEKSDEENRIQELQTKLEKAEREETNSRERLTAMEEKCGNLSDELEKARGVISELTALKTTMETEIQAAKKVVEELSNSASNNASESEAEILNLRQMLKERDYQLEDSALQIGNLQKELEQIKENLNEELQDIKNQRDAVQTRVEDLETNLDEAQRNLEEARNRLGEEKAALEDEINQMRVRLPEVIPIAAPDLLEECLIKVDEPVLSAEPVFQVEIDQLKSELQVAEQNYGILQEERDKLIEELDLSRSESQKFRKEFEDSVENLKRGENRIQILEESSVKQENYISSLQKEKDELLEEIKKKGEELSNQSNLLDQNLASEQEKTKVLENELEEAKQQLQSLNDQLSEKKNVFVSLEGERASLMKEVEKMRGELVERTKEFEAKLGESTQREELLRTSIHNAQREIEELKNTEEIVSELRKELEQSRLQLKEITSKCSILQEEASNLKEQLSHALSNLADKEAEIGSLVEKFEKLERDTQEEMDKKNVEQTEELKIREQYSSALENHRNNEEQLGKRVTEKEAENKKLQSELENLAQEFSEYREQQQKEQENAINELKKKAESKLGKMKKEFEKDVAAAKSELLLKVDEHRSALSEKEKKLDEMRIEKAKLEQQLIGEEEVRRELNRERQNNEQITNQLKLSEERLAETSVLQKDLKELQTSNRQLLDEKEKLSSKVTELESVSEETVKKAAAKQDLESKKVIRELQREVKQLYAELTDKSTALDGANSQIRELEEKSKNVQAVPAENHQKASGNKSDEAYELAQEEIDSLKRRLTDAHKEIDVLRDQKHSNSTKNNNSDDNSFAHPTEQEYLRNVLYRYMNERETLGKEIVTLARVIGTVSRFSKKQLDDVLAKEEHRVASWSQTLAGVSNTKH